jgi:hypothetical protein
MRLSQPRATLRLRPFAKSSPHKSSPKREPRSAAAGAIFSRRTSAAETAGTYPAYATRCGGAQNCRRATGAHRRSSGLRPVQRRSRKDPANLSECAAAPGGSRPQNAGKRQITASAFPRYLPTTRTCRRRVPADDMLFGARALGYDSCGRLRRLAPLRPVPGVDCRFYASMNRANIGASVESRCGINRSRRG